MDLQVLWANEDGKLITWFVKIGSIVDKGQILASCEPSSIKLLSPSSGTLKSKFFENGSEIKANQVICSISSCFHSTLTEDDLCVSCLEFISDTSAYSIIIRPSNDRIKRLKIQVQEDTDLKIKRLLETKRLILILDLDQTILHTVKLFDSCNLEQNIDPDEPDVYLYSLSQNSKFMVKFRPGLRQFLLRVNEMFQIYIYTMANMEYAEKIVWLINKFILVDIDPKIKRQIIGTRIISRDHTEDLFKRTKDIKNVISDPNIVVILDDSEEVWHQHSKNLINLEKFTFWKCQPDLNISYHVKTKTEETQIDLYKSDVTTPQFETFEILKPFNIPYDKSQNNDQTLNSVLEVLENLYKNYFELNLSSKFRSIIEILPRIKKSVLSGRNLCFSGIFPKNHDLTKTLQLISSFGATFTEDLIPNFTTHFICSKLKTEKYKKAINEKGVYIVQISWFLKSIQFWKCQPEIDYKFEDVPLFKEYPPNIIEQPLWSEFDRKIDQILECSKDENYQEQIENKRFKDNEEIHFNEIIESDQSLLDFDEIFGECLSTTDNEI